MRVPMSASMCHRRMFRWCRWTWCWRRAVRSAPTPCDQDRDTHRSVRCAGGDDCDDLDCHRYPMNTEVADTLGHDEDCNACTVSNTTPGPMRTGDGDGDSYVSNAFFNRWDNWDPPWTTPPTCDSVTDRVDVCPDPSNPRCGTATARVVRGQDCNDTSTAASPRGTEACDGADNNCDGIVDNLAGRSADEYCRDGSGPSDCYDMRCGGRPGTSACVACIRQQCEATGPRCTADATCMMPGSSCLGVRRCDEACTLSSVCTYPTESCNYRDDDCDGSFDEGLGRACAQTFQRGPAGGLDLTAEFTPMFGAVASASSDSIVLTSTTQHIGAAMLRTAVPRAGSFVVSGQVSIARINPAFPPTFFDVYLTTQPVTSAGNEVTYSPGTLGYRISANFVRGIGSIETIDGSRLTQLTSDDLTDNPLNFRAGGSLLGTTPQRNDFQVSLQDSLVSFGIAWSGVTPRIISISDPGASALYGRALYVTIVARETDIAAELLNVTVRRGAFRSGGGGPCPDGAMPEPYCPR
nr:putative metal-binding motif-containing protein [Deltaproteobacteria bacterium]